MKNKEEIINRFIEMESILQNTYSPNLLKEMEDLIKNLSFTELMELDEEITKRMDKSG